MLGRRRQSRATPRSTYTEWWWPPSPTIYRTIPAGYTSFEHVVRPEVDPGPGADYVWAHEFKLVAGDAGYIGLQTRSQVADEGAGKVAVFFFRDAVAARDAAWAIPSVEDVGLICGIPFPWEAGQAYEMRVWTDVPGWWSAGVRTEGSGRESIFGRIQVPPDWRRLGCWSVMWTEYRGALARCQDLAPSQVTFSMPTADQGSVQPQRQQNRLGPGTCDGSQVDDVPGGVRHMVGSGP